MHHNFLVEKYIFQLKETCDHVVYNWAYIKTQWTFFQKSRLGNLCTLYKIQFSTDRPFLV